VLVCYDFHSEISDKEEDLMFATKLRLFSIETIVVPLPVMLQQPINLIASIGLNLVEQVYVHVELIYVLPIPFDIPVEPVFVLPIQIVIPPDTFKQHLPKTFFQPKVRKMEIDEMLVRIKVQNLCIVGWTITEKKQLTKINLDSEKKLQHVKINVDLELVVSYQLIDLLKEFKDIFAWTYKDLKGIPLEII